MRILNKDQDAHMIIFMRLNVPLEDGDERLLKELVATAGVSRAAWVRGAIRAASSSAETAGKIAERADNSGWGGYREGAGRPPLSP